MLCRVKEGFDSSLTLQIEFDVQTLSIICFMVSGLQLTNEVTFIDENDSMPSRPVRIDRLSDHESIAMLVSGVD
jgi:hypothetical protein